MAYTVSKTVSVAGDMRVVYCSVTADAASGTVPTGLNNIVSVTIGPQSMATSAIKMSVSGGTVTVSNAASGDGFYLAIAGK